MSAYLGIDPGASGGVALIHPDGVWFRSLGGDPPTINSQLAIVRAMTKDTTLHGLMEQVSGFQGKARPGSSMFNFGRSYGWLEMGLTANLLSFDVMSVRPQQWQKGLGIAPHKKSESDTDWKNRLKREASKRFPQLVVTLAVADALLIAAYCQQENE